MSNERYDYENNDRRSGSRRQEDWISNSPIEDTLKLLIENLSMLNAVISQDAKDNKDNIQEIISRLSKIPIDNVIKNLKEQNTQHILLNNIIQRLADNKTVDINEKDIDFVFSELITDAYKTLENKKKYAVVFAWGKRLFWAIMAGGLAWLIELLLNITSKL